jgi:Neurotransmitter-gated ion-channel ligand binding domain/Neurotransmitter-gated ion-channel transmembrane region
LVVSAALGRTGPDQAFGWILLLEMRDMLRRFLCGWIVVAGLCVNLRAEDDASASSIQLPPGHPVTVSVGVELVEVSQINDRDERFELEFYVYYTWKDPRFAFDPVREGTQRKLINVDTIWNPDPQLLDELDITVRGGKVVHSYPDGTLCYSRYYRGTIAGNLDLHEFPLDKQTLEVDLEESGFEADQVVFVPDEARALNPARALPHGWLLRGMSTEAKTSSYSKTGEKYTMLRVNLAIERDPHYYVWAIVLPLIPIVAAAWVVFWMHPKEFSSQISVGITAMLTVVAYRISIDSSLPPLNYMTRMDYFLLACQVFVFGAFIVVVGIHVLYSINSADSRAVAHRLTVQCRWLPPILLAGASVLLTYLPASCGSWIMAGAGLLFFAWIMPAPSQFQVWWGAIVHPERLARLAGTAEGVEHESAENVAAPTAAHESSSPDHHAPLRIKSNRQTTAA